MIRETAARFFPYAYLWEIYKRTKIKPNNLDLFFQWIVQGKDKSDDKKLYEAFKDIAKKSADLSLQGEVHYPLYRGIVVAPQAIHDLQEITKPIKLKPRVLTAWRPSYADVDERMVQDANSENVGLVLEASPKRVVLNITPALVQWLDEDHKLAGLTRDLNETIIYGNGIDFVISKSIKTLNYKGKSITLERFQMQTPQPKEQKISYDDYLAKLLHGVPIKVIRLSKQPPDGKSFEYIVKNTTNSTFIDITNSIESKGFRAGSVRVSKRGKKVDLVDKINRMGISVEENANMRIVKITVFPLEKL